jgi:SHS2 domain-containing protein
MFETFDHTADLGLRVRAPDLDTLFIDAARALFAAIVENPASVQPIRKVDIKLEGDQLDFLFFDWLRELLYRFDTEHLLFCRFELHVDEAGLSAEAWGEPLDRSRHNLEHEVKAITYHGLRVQKVPDGWLAEVIVDI